MLVLPGDLTAEPAAFPDRRSRIVETPAVAEPAQEAVRALAAEINAAER